MMDKIKGYPISLSIYFGILICNECLNFEGGTTSVFQLFSICLDRFGYLNLSYSV